jgi:hypothetical protein
MGKIMNTDKEEVKNIKKKKKWWGQSHTERKQ